MALFSQFKGAVIKEDYSRQGQEKKEERKVCLYEENIFIKTVVVILISLPLFQESDYIMHILYKFSKSLKN